MKATAKQVSYAMILLEKSGYSTRYMGAKFKNLGATMRERSGTVRNWLENKSVSDLSKLIDDLK